MANLLVVDDDPIISRFLSATLRTEGYEPRHVETFDEARRLLLEEPFDLVVCDVHLDAGHTGIELLAVRAASPGKPQFVFVTGDAELETAVEALRAGAFDYIPKPIDTPRLLLAVARALKARSRPPTGQHVVDTTERLIGHTPSIVEVFNSIGRASAVDSPVLLVGEDGVGKEQVAREIHRHSPRASGPFVVADAANFADVGVPEAVLRTASGGTLYLEHLDALPRPAQTRLARIVEKRSDPPAIDVSPDVRYICAVGARGELLARELYYVVSAIEVTIPPLRARRDDIPLLVDHALTRISPRVHRPLSVDAEALAILRSYDWPGNLSELSNVLERAAVRAPTGVLTAAEIRDVLPSPRTAEYPAGQRIPSPPEAPAVPKFQGGRYVLTRVLRLTEMSETWEGVQPALARKVIVKFHTIEDEQRLARFEREARIQATLRHPNIPTIFEAGTDPGIPGRMFLAMEFIEGFGLERYVLGFHKGMAALDRARRICGLVRQVALALHYLHGKGIVHRDVKPENVIVTGEECAFLLDYGIARWFSRDERLTSEDMLIGSLPFMSPEQLLGRPDDVDARTDIWALGVSLHLLLVGQVPFAGESLEEVSRRVAEQAPVPVRTIDPRLPRTVEAVVLRALAKSPWERFPSAEAMAEALARL